MNKWRIPMSIKFNPGYSKMVRVTAYLFDKARPDRTPADRDREDYAKAWHLAWKLREGLLRELRKADDQA